jgi:hypothetical protein
MKKSFIIRRSEGGLSQSKKLCFAILLHVKKALHDKKPVLSGLVWQAKTYQTIA